LARSRQAGRCASGRSPPEAVNPIVILESLWLASGSKFSSDSAAGDYLFA
jgi:hypothetical protein